MKKDKEKEIAEELFIYSGKTLKEISELTGISENTLSKWSKSGEKSWKERKQDTDISPLQLKEKLLIEAEKLSKGESSAIKSYDELSKCIAAIDRLEKKFKITPNVISAVFKEYDLWLMGVNSTIAKESMKYHKLFLAYKIKQEIGNNG